MSAIPEFAENGLRFRYPENWGLDREENESGWTVSLQSPGTAFVTVTFDEDMPAPANMAETALAAMRDVYSDLEAEERVDTIAGLPAVGHDIQFFSLDLTNTCWTRSFAIEQGTILILCQTSDIELEKNGPILKAICASVQLDEEAA